MSASEPEILLGKLTRREFRERMASGELAGCLIPVAAIEQHLEHMAMEHDWRSVGLVTRAVAERLAPRVLVTEGLMCGISEHHMRHPGTLTLSPGTFLAVLGDMIDSMVRAGFKNIIVVNGHGGNIEPVRGTWDQFLRRFEGVNLHFLSYWDTLGQADADELLQGAKRMPDDFPGTLRNSRPPSPWPSSPRMCAPTRWPIKRTRTPDWPRRSRGRSGSSGSPSAWPSSSAK